MLSDRTPEESENMMINRLNAPYGARYFLTGHGPRAPDQRGFVLMRLMALSAF